MASYSVRIKKSARKELETVATKSDRRRIVARIQALAQDPQPAGAVKLSGRELYRIRQGQYRILYSIEDRVLIVQIIRIGHRSKVYIKR